MQIVIDIPEKLYEECKRMGDVRDILFESIRNGTVLPKGHGRLIDENMIAYTDGVFEDGTAYTVVHPYSIENTPTVIEADKESR